jgi:nitrite reductase/ring-hydroxylating ferredoxin subunit
MKLFRVDSHPEVLIGRLQGKLFACNNSCPHRGASLVKGELRGDKVVCHMHGYEYNVFTGRLENMKSWKKEETWMEQSPEWRKSGDLLLYRVYEKDRIVYVHLADQKR